MWELPRQMYQGDLSLVFCQRLELMVSEGFSKLSAGLG